MLHNDLFDEPFISLTPFPTSFLPHFESVLFGGKKVVKGGVVRTWGSVVLALEELKNEFAGCWDRLGEDGGEQDGRRLGGAQCDCSLGDS